MIFHEAEDPLKEFLKITDKEVLKLHDDRTLINQQISEE
jgi:hypothetical protein